MDKYQNQLKRCVLKVLFSNFLLIFLLVLFINPTVKATVIWDGDAALGTGVFGQFNLDGNANVTRVNDPLYGLVWKFYKPAGSNRCESSHLPNGLHAGEGDTWYIGWRFKVDMPQNTSTNAVFQWKSYPAAQQNFPVVLKHVNGNFRMLYQDPDYQPNYPWDTPTSTNTWISVVLKLNVSRNENIGYVELWYNGVKQTFDNGTTRYYARTLDDGYNDPKWGVYGASGTEVTNYVHGLKIATTYAEAAPSSSGSGTISNGTYAIQARHSGKAMVVESASTANNANIFQYSYGGSNTNDEWVVTDIGGGYYSIINDNSGKALSIDGGGTSRGLNAKQYTYNAWSHQKYEIIDMGGGYYRLKNSQGFCIDVEGGGTANGDNIIQWDCSSGENQQWSFTSVGNDNFTITGRMGTGEQAIGTDEGFRVYPNPLDGNRANIHYTNSEAGYVRLAVYNSKGQSIVKLVEGYQKQGNYVLPWNTSGVPAGIYMARIEDSTGIRTVKLVIVE